MSKIMNSIIDKALKKSKEKVKNKLEKGSSYLKSIKYKYNVIKIDDSYKMNHVENILENNNQIKSNIQSVLKNRSDGSYTVEISYEIDDYGYRSKSIRATAYNS